MGTIDRSYLRFTQKVREAFMFLQNEGFREVEALPTLVRYLKGNIEVDVYHGRQSYEIGAGITASATRYSMSEIVRASDPEMAKSYRNPIATTPDGVTIGIKELSTLMQRYGTLALRGDPRFFGMLEDQRKQWAEDYALEVLAAQLRPQAEEAFRSGDYLRAAELYGRIQTCLSPAEARKLALAQERSKQKSGTGHN